MAKCRTGKDFGADGKPSDKVVAIDEARAHSLAEGLRDATVSVRSVDTKPYRSSPRHHL